MLQEGVDELYKWTIEWLLNLNISKCKVISFGRNIDKIHMYKISDKDAEIYLFESSRYYKRFGDSYR